LEEQSKERNENIEKRRSGKRTYRLSIRTAIQLCILKAGKLLEVHVESS